MPAFVFLVSPLARIFALDTLGGIFLSRSQRQFGQATNVTKFVQRRHHPEPLFVPDQTSCLYRGAAQARMTVTDVSCHNKSGMRRQSKGIMMKNKEKCAGERQETAPAAITASPDAGQRTGGADRMPGTASAVSSKAEKAAIDKPRTKNPRGCVLIRRIRLR
jgi:hypothetical protein